VKANAKHESNKLRRRNDDAAANRPLMGDQSRFTEAQIIEGPPEPVAPHRQAFRSG